MLKQAQSCLEKVIPGDGSGELNPDISIQNEELRPKVSKERPESSLAGRWGRAPSSRKP